MKINSITRALGMPATSEPDVYDDPALLVERFRYGQQATEEAYSTVRDVYKPSMGADRAKFEDALVPYEEAWAAMFLPQSVFPEAYNKKTGKMNSRKFSCPAHREADLLSYGHKPEKQENGKLSCNTLPPSYCTAKSVLGKAIEAGIDPTGRAKSDLEKEYKGTSTPKTDFEKCIEAANKLNQLFPNLDDADQQRVLKTMPNVV